MSLWRSHDEILTEMRASIPGIVKFQNIKALMPIYVVEFVLDIHWSHDIRYIARPTARGAVFMLLNVTSSTLRFPWS